jgi:hypothetical protein
VVENALPVIRWHPVQWHSIVITGGLVIANRTRSHLQPPAIGRTHSGMKD